MHTSDLKVEYKEIGANIRHYGDMRFKQLTLFVALTAGFLTVIFQFECRLTFLQLSLLKIVGVWVSIVFWIMDERACDYWNTFLKRGQDIEKDLNYEQYLRRPEQVILTATNTVRIFYFSIAILWLMFLKRDIWPWLFYFLFGCLVFLLVYFFVRALKMKKQRESK